MMKKILLIMAIVGALAACRNGSGNSKRTDSPAAVRSADSARAQSDSLLQNAPDTLIAK